MAIERFRLRPAWVISSVLAIVSVATPGLAQGKPPAGRKIPLPPTPPNAPPTISVTSRLSPFKDAERTLARFISALSRGKRRDAAIFFSNRVPAGERSAFVKGEWPLPASSQKKSFGQMLFLKDLLIQPTSEMYKDLLVLQVTARKLPFGDKRTVSGYLKVPMRKEGADWKVELRRRGAS